MSGQVKVFLEKIEITRERLHQLGLEKGLSNPQVVEMSQKLDSLLNEYYRLEKKNKNLI